MTKIHLIMAPAAFVSLCLTAGCGSKGSEDKALEEAAAVASSPFSISDSEANEMGATPAGEMSLPKGYDPYAEMARNASDAPPHP